DPRELCAMLARETSSLRERAGLPAKTPIGAVVPGILDEERELVELAVNLGWEDLSLGAMLREHLTAPLALGHEAPAGGTAEAAWGAGRLLPQNSPTDGGGRQPVAVLPYETHVT